MSRYAELQSQFVRATIEALMARIAERFPGSGLSQVAAELLVVADQNQSVIVRLRRPLWPIRVLTALTIVALVALADGPPALSGGHRAPRRRGGPAAGADAGDNRSLLA